MPIVPALGPVLAPAVTAAGPPLAPDAVETGPDLGTVIEVRLIQGKHGVPQIVRRRRKRQPDEVLP